ncbi:MAG TPA: CPBP family intramembrane glutamic endopeptidase [Pyrinomonadaceae bacterium]|nr:CPBP family intramembrane glutamic endopeptidase [Pyrinomonadaceae bacterium]
MPNIFINEFGRTRSVWRAALFVASFVAILLLLTIILRGIYVALFEFGTFPRLAFLPDLIFRVSLLMAALGGGYVCAHWLEGLPWRSLGVTFHQNWLRDLLVGFAIGFVVLAVGVGVAAAGGGLRFSFDGAILPIVRSLVGSALLLCVAALAEEAIFRGYPLQTFARAHLAWFGILVTLVFFAYVHLTNPNATLGMTFINTAIAGLWFGIAYLRTRSLWFPLGLHWAWNWALGAFFGLPVSGMNLVSHPLLQGSDAGPAWLTGGNYGIEGGIAGTIALVLATILTWRTRLVSATPELKKLTSEENPVVTSPVVSIRPADDAV